MRAVTEHNDFVALDFNARGNAGARRLDRKVAQQRSVIEAGGVVRGSVIGEDSTVGPGAVVEDSIVGDGARVGSGRRVIGERMA